MTEFEAFDKKIQDIMIERELKTIRDIDYQIHEIQIMVAINELTDKVKAMYSSKRERQVFHEMGDILFKDIHYFLDSAAYFIANSYYHLDYLNDPLREKMLVGGYMVHTNFENIHNLRFFECVDAAFQAIYNYWDRIGDLTYVVINKHEIPQHNYFGTVCSDFITLDKNRWIYEFLNSESGYSYIRNYRNDLVHGRSIRTRLLTSMPVNAISKNKMKNLVEERNSLPDKLKNQYLNCFEGLYQFCILLKDQ